MNVFKDSPKCFYSGP